MAVRRQGIGFGQVLQVPYGLALARSHRANEAGSQPVYRRRLLHPEAGAVASQHLIDSVRLRQRLYLKNRITCRHEPRVRLRRIRFAVEELAVLNFICGEAVRASERQPRML
jgi:hypothetical protein